MVFVCCDSSHSVVFGIRGIVFLAQTHSAGRCDGQQREIYDGRDRLFGGQSKLNDSKQGRMMMGRIVKMTGKNRQRHAL